MTYILLGLIMASIIINSYALYRLLPKNRKKKLAILLDTSGLIDGRIVEVVKSGFVPAQLLVPRFVIAELQLLADKADHLKRERARYGLSVIQDLQDSRNTEVEIISDDIATESGVDEKLVQLALKRSAMLYTTDFNLLKVAEIEGVRVLNVNELAQNLRPVRLPGEQLDIKVVQKGQERDQGVGYLDDGTMVVIENAKNALGKTLRVEFTRNLQTTAGRMMFATALRQDRAKQRPAVRSTPKAAAAGRKPAAPRQKRTAEDRLLAAIDKQ